MTYKIKDNDGIYYEIKDIKKFAKHIFQYHSIGISLHQEKGYNFTVDDTFRKKIANFLKNEEKMSISIKELSNNKFEITVNHKLITNHIVLLTDEYHDIVTKKKISKKKLIEYSFQFLLDREPNTSILSSFKLNIISKYFPEYENEIKKVL